MYVRIVTGVGVRFIPSRLCRRRRTISVPEHVAFTYHCCLVDRQCSPAHRGTQQVSICPHFVTHASVHATAQVFHVVRAFQEAGVCGAALCLPVAASECLSCGVVDAPVILASLQSLSLALDGAGGSDQSSFNPDGRTKGALLAQDACLGAAGLVVACDGKVALPAGFAASVFEGLRKTARHRRVGDSGARVTALLALGSMCGCPLLPGGELTPRCVAFFGFSFCPSFVCFFGTVYARVFIG